MVRLTCFVCTFSLVASLVPECVVTFNLNQWPVHTWFPHQISTSANHPCKMFSSWTEIVQVMI